MVRFGFPPMVYGVIFKLYTVCPRKKLQAEFYRIINFQSIE